MLCIADWFHFGHGVMTASVELCFSLSSYSAIFYYGLRKGRKDCFHLVHSLGHLEGKRSVKLQNVQFSEKNLIAYNKQFKETSSFFLFFHFSHLIRAFEKYQ